MAGMQHDCAQSPDAADHVVSDYAEIFHCATAVSIHLPYDVLPQSTHVTCYAGTTCHWKLQQQPSEHQVLDVYENIKAAHITHHAACTWTCRL